jgi:uncharacterized protein YprB with RNaseH-like and TPR domain
MINKNWEVKEIKTLKNEYERGIPVITISILINRSVSAIENKIHRLGLLRKHEKLIKNKRVGYFDIETDGLKPDMGTILCYNIKERDKEIYYGDCINENDLKQKDRFKLDKRVVKNLINDLSKFDVIVTYYGTGFDFRFSRARALFHRLDFPGYGSSNHHDLYYTARSKLGLTRNSLENVCWLLGIEGKNHVDKKIWYNAKFADKESLKYIYDHNKRDVRILELAHKKLEKYTAGIRRSI